MSDKRVPEHVFISYSHRDKEFALKIAADLEKVGVKVWIDRMGLQPGTSNWNNTIRDALQRSFAVLLLASPSSGQSTVVQGELSIAKRYGCPVYPIWIAGKWENSISLDMVHTQYIDCRAAFYERGLSQLIEILKRDIDARAIKHFPYKRKDYIPQGYFTIAVSNDDGVAMRFSSYQSLGSLLDDLYLHYLSDLYAPYTYGKDWVLVNEKEALSLLIVPWNWLVESSRKQSLSVSQARWATSSLEAYGLTFWSFCRVVKLPLAAFGIATNYPLLIELLNDEKGIDALTTLLDKVAKKQLQISQDDEAFVKVVSPEMVHNEDYKYQLVVCNYSHPYIDRSIHDGKAIVIERWDLLEGDTLISFA